MSGTLTRPNANPILGAEAHGFGAPGLPAWGQTKNPVTGQVWARASVPKSWWIVDAQGTAHLCHESTITVLGQCDDAELPLEVSV